MLRRCTPILLVCASLKSPVFESVCRRHLSLDGPEEIGLDVWKEDIETESERLSVPGLADCEKTPGGEVLQEDVFREEAHCIAKCINFLINYT